jgi:hypothetical protein
LLGGFHQPVQHRVRVDRKDPGGGAYAQAFRSTGPYPQISSTDRRLL